MHRFRIAALADPQSLPRITGFFGQRGLVPAAVAVQTGEGAMRLRIDVHGLDDDAAAVIASKLGALFAITDVAMTDGVPAE
jgi:acetolactate synthase regulatory subunit